VASRTFIDRLILALALLSGIAVLGMAGVALVVWQYFQSPLPVVEVRATYPGANAQVVADVVGAPIEQQVIGVENMVDMSHHCTDNGDYRLTITFRRGTDLNMAQVLVQNRVALAMPVIPDVVQRAGISVIRLPGP
jgi:multidrug efflux pump subunit AcrB